MKRLLWVSVLVFTLGACCKAICEDQGLQVSARNMQETDTDTVYMIKYKPNTGFTERLDTIKRLRPTPAGPFTLGAQFMEFLDYSADWKIVIPAVNKEYFISGIELKTERCHCTGDDYKTVKRFRFNNTEIEGSSVNLN